MFRHLDHTTKKALARFQRRYARVDTRALAASLPKSIEHIVVIPAYGEREFIWRPLMSLLWQQGIDLGTVAVIVVVNNPARQPNRRADESERDYQARRCFYQQARTNNQEALKVLGSLVGDDFPAARVAESERDYLCWLRADGPTVRILDRATRGQTLPDQEANIVGARNSGIAVALEFFNQQKRNGLIFHTDADTAFAPGAMQSVKNRFKRSPSLAGLTGSKVYDYAETPSWPEQEGLYWQEARSRYTEIMRQLARFAVGGHDNSRVIFSGPCIAAGAFETARVGGFSLANGCEDGVLGDRLAQTGDIAQLDDFLVHPLNRDSWRIDSRQGQGRRAIRSKQDLRKFKDGQVLPPVEQIFVEMNNLLKAQGRSQQQVLTKWFDNDQMNRLASYQEDIPPARLVSLSRVINELASAWSESGAKSSKSARRKASVTPRRTGEVAIGKIARAVASPGSVSTALPLVEEAAQNLGNVPLRDQPLGLRSHIYRLQVYPRLRQARSAKARRDILRRFLIPYKQAERSRIFARVGLLRNWQEQNQDDNSKQRRIQLLLGK